MNSIKGFLDKSDYEVYDDYLNFQVDGNWLDEKLNELYPELMIKGLVPTLLFWLQSEEDREIVWNRILPSVGSKTICPILMCPDDCDFTCTLILAEIENSGKTIKWNRIGLDKTKIFDSEKFGASISWFDKLKVLEFEREEYLEMLDQFKRHFAVDKEKWENAQHKEI